MFSASKDFRQMERLHLLTKNDIAILVGFGQLMCLTQGMAIWHFSLGKIFADLQIISLYDIVQFYAMWSEISLQGVIFLLIDSIVAVLLILLYGKSMVILKNANFKYASDKSYKDKTDEFLKENNIVLTRNNHLLATVFIYLYLFILCVGSYITHYISIGLLISIFVILYFLLLEKRYPR